MSKKKELEGLFYYHPPNYLTPSLYGEDRSVKPDYSKIFLDNCSGITIGSPPGAIPCFPLGIAQGKEGNLLGVGSNGCGKSRNIVKPTLKSWNGAVVTLDIKGELFEYYLILYEAGIVKRKPIRFDPTNEAGKCYDPLRGIIPCSYDETVLLWDCNVYISVRYYSG